MLNDYIKLTKDYLKNYVYYQQAIKNLEADINDRELELKSESVKIANYSAEASGESELNSTERAADSRIVLEKEKASMIKDLERVRKQLTKIDEAIGLLPTDEQEAVKMFYVDRLNYRAMSDRNHFSERWCKKKVNAGTKAIAFMIFGTRAEENVLFVQSVS